MNKEIWKKIESIYDQALDLAVDDRLQFVKKHTDSEGEIYNQVIKMLVAGDDTFMEKYPGLVSASSSLENHDLKSLGHYKILRNVATGGMGRVYLAQSKNADVPINVALKTIRIELINEELETKFHNEKQILSKLKHKNIASLIDAGVFDNKIPYIATEWVDGKNINDYCSDKQLDIKSRLKLFQQICTAVFFAHNKLVIHRDIKPDNILVDGHGQVKLLDFGIAKIVDDNETSRTQTQIYTPDYAAPEQINGQLCTVVTDVYSLGVVLYELLTNSRRFELSGLSITEKINAICAPKTIDIKSIASQLPYSISQVEGSLLTIVNKAMHVDQNRRYESVASLAIDIDNYLNNHPVSAMKDSIVYKTKMFLLRNRLASFLTTLIFVVVLSGLYINNKQINMKLQEAEKSKIMLDFFQDILKSASPSQGGSTNITVKQMFDSGIARYNFDTISDPYIKAELSSQIGIIYGQLGNQEKQRQYVNDALHYYSNNLNTKDNRDTYLKYSTEIGTTYTNNEEFDIASTHILNALTKIEGFNLNPVYLAEAYLELAIIEKEKNRYKETQVTPKADEYLKKAEIFAKQSNSPMLFGEVDMFKHDYGRVSDAEKRAYVESAEKHFLNGKQGDFNPNVQNARSVRAQLLTKVGKYQEAEQLYEKIRQATIATYGSDDFIGLITQAENLNILGRYDKAKALLTESQEVHQMHNLAKDPPYYGSLLYTAEMLVELHEFALAEELFNKNFEYFSKILPKSHSYLKVAVSKKSDLYLKSANDEKLKQQQLLLESYLQEDIKNHKLTSYFKYLLDIKLGNINLFFNDYEKANTHFEKAKKITESNPQRYNQGKAYWEMQTGLALAKIKSGDIGGFEDFHENKQKLLAMVSTKSWYDEFFRID